MDRDPKYLIIGSIVVVLFLGLALFLIWASKINTSSANLNYVVYLKQQSPAGLQKDGQVTMKGIKVGTIQDISFDPDDVEKVMVEMLIDADAPIKTDTQALVKGNYVTGLSHIELAKSTKAAELLRKAGKKKKGRYVIPEGESTIQQIQNTLPEILNETSKILRQIEKFLNDDNAAQIGKIIKNTEVLSEEIASKSGELGKILDSVTTSASNLSKLIEDIKIGTSNMLKNTNRILADSNVQLNQTTDSITQTMQSLKHGKETVLGATEKDLLE